MRRSVTVFLSNGRAVVTYELLASSVEPDRVWFDHAAYLALRSGLIGGSDLPGLLFGFVSPFPSWLVDN
jgi:hypothetical protein